MDAGSTVYAVIDTNVLVSALLAKDKASNPSLIIRSIIGGQVIPVLNSEIVDEYWDVLSRPKFKFPSSAVAQLINFLVDVGYHSERMRGLPESFPDEDDVVFYEVAMSVDDGFLVTGNIKHFPLKPFIVTPARMVEILEERGLL